MGVGDDRVNRQLVMCFATLLDTPIAIGKLCGFLPARISRPVVQTSNAKVFSAAWGGVLCWLTPCLLNCTTGTALQNVMAQLTNLFKTKAFQKAKPTVRCLKMVLRIYQDVDWENSLTADGQQSEPEVIRQLDASFTRPVTSSNFIKLLFIFATPRHFTRLHGHYLFQHACRRPSGKLDVQLTCASTLIFP